MKAGQILFCSLLSVMTPHLAHTQMPAKAAPANDFASNIKATLAMAPKIQVGATSIETVQLNELYKLRAHKPIFVGKSGLLPMGDSLKSVLTDLSEDRGLSAWYYWTPEIESRLASMDPAAQLELELLLANSYLQYAKDVSTGRTNPADPAQNITDIELKKRSLKDLTYLNKIVSGDTASFIAGLEELDPPHTVYRRLVSLLARYRRMDPADFSTIVGKTLRRGDQDPVIPQIRRRLYDLGVIRDPKERMNPSVEFDSVIAQGVIWLQTSHKLDVDGVIGKGTYNALNVPLENRIRQIRANLERWRLLPRNLGDHYAFVDLGHQTLEVWKNKNLTMFMRVVVGQELRQTPTFIDQAVSVIVNPYWTAPSSIVVKDIIPHSLQNPNYFEQLKMRVFKGKTEIDPHSVDWTQYTLANPPPYTFREDPGDQNSLGRLKIDLSENHHAIYMHDTNAKHLFEQEKRAYSSGCIRLEKPVEFAEYLLQDQGIYREHIEDMIYNQGLVAERIKIKTPLKVYIVGTTIAVDAQNIVRWGVDIYKQDNRILDAMDGKRVSPEEGEAKKEVEPAVPAPAPVVGPAPVAAPQPDPQPAPKVVSKPSPKPKATKKPVAIDPPDQQDYEPVNEQPKDFWQAVEDFFGGN